MQALAARFAAFLFDLDGTLIDSTTLITSAFAHTFRTHGCPEPAAEALRAGFGTPLRAQLTTFARDAAEVEAMAATYRGYHAEHHDRLVRPYPGIRDQIARLYDRRAKLAIVTSKGREAAILGLQQCGLDAYFDVLVTPADVTECKPHPAPVEAALDRLGAAASEAVFIGDSTHDVQAGRAAGVRTAAVLWGPYSRAALAPHEPDYWLERPSEIGTVLSEPVPTAPRSR